jgi:hypothetical protein
MFENFEWTCDYCGSKSTKPMKIAITVDPVSKHYCQASCFVSYCEKHHRLQDSIAYAMYKDLVESEAGNSTDPKEPIPGGTDDTQVCGDN